MRIAAVVSLLLCALPCSSLADKPRVGRAMLDQAEKSVEAKFAALWPAEPVEVLGLTQGAYITGYGVVFMSKVNLAPAAGISPFHPDIKPEDVKRMHDKKAQRMDQFRTAMREALLDSAASLDSAPLDEQIVLGVSLFYWTWENHDGLPAQIVMHASRKLLLQAKTGAADKASITSEEF